MLQKNTPIYTVLIKKTPVPWWNKSRKSVFEERTCAE